MKFKYIYFIIILFAISRCARRGNPTGGPKDENAPIIINAIPAHNTTNFNKKEIRIYFDEFIKLKDVQKQLVISPPLKYTPIITPLGLASKRLTIKIIDTLKENTTYVFNFGESIEDNNEGNKLRNFKYIFSTGDFIDSLKIKGTIKDAFFDKSEEYVSILLYEINEQYSDSTVFKEKPLYIANTLDSLNWEITNIKKGNYKLIALKENTSDYIYHPKGDKLGFIDTIVSIPTEKDFEIKLFKEIPAFELANPIEVSKGHLIFGFQGDGKNLSAKVIDLNDFWNDKEKGSIKYETFLEKEKDTMHFYYKSKELDSVKIKFENGDFLEEKVVKFRLKQTDSLLLKSNVRGTYYLRDTLTIISNNPISNLDELKFKLTDKDTLNVKFQTEIVKTNNLKLKILFDRKPEERYRFEILPNGITDFFEQTNDTLKVNFNTKAENYYGSINLKINTKKYPIIVELLTDKNNIVEAIIATKNQDFMFENLVPSKYKIRVIYDKNNNGIWDTGEFLKNKQPEDVYYFNKEIEVKENWFLNENFTIE